MSIIGVNSGSGTEFGPYSADTQPCASLTIPSAGTITAIGIKGRTSTGSTSNAAFVIYDNSTTNSGTGKNAPNNVLGTASYTLGSSSAFYSVTGLSIPVSAGLIWVKQICQTGFYVDYDPGATDQAFACWGRAGVSPFTFPDNYIDDPQNFTGSEGWDAAEFYMYVDFTASGGTSEQLRFRFRYDNGSETTAGWITTESTNSYTPLNQNVRIRTLVDTAGDVSNSLVSLYYKRSDEGSYLPVPTSSSIPAVYGTVTFQSIGTGANGSTSVAPSYPASIAAGDYLTLHVSSGGTGNPTPSTPSGWTLLATGTSTDGTFGIDTGPRRMTVFGKIAAGTETGTLSVTITSGNTCRGTIARWTKSGSGTWTIEAQGADDSTSGTGVSMTTASMNWNTGDATCVAVCQRVDSATQSAQSLTASGVTFGTMTNRASTAVTTGNDHRHVVDTFAAITGTSNVNATATWAYTASAAVSAGGVIVRLREYTAATPNRIYISASSNITAGGEATTAQLTPPSGKTTSDFTTGRMWDDENGSDSIDIASDFYSEFEWCLQAQSPAANTEIYQFRVYFAGNPLDTYTLTPQWTIGNIPSARRRLIIIT